MFLKTIEKETPAELQVHLILDNYATHKHPNVKAWLVKHPRFHLHFTPTSSSWLNLVERWFRELGDKALRRGVFHSVPDLIAAIETYLTAHNDHWSGQRPPTTSSPKSPAVASHSKPSNKTETHH